MNAVWPWDSLDLGSRLASKKKDPLAADAIQDISTRRRWWYRSLPFARRLFARHLARATNPSLDTAERVDALRKAVDIRLSLNPERFDNGDLDIAEVAKMLDDVDSTFRSERVRLHRSLARQSLDDTEVARSEARSVARFHLLQIAEVWPYAHREIIDMYLGPVGKGTDDASIVEEHLYEALRIAEEYEPLRQIAIERAIPFFMRRSDVAGVAYSIDVQRAIAGNYREIPLDALTWMRAEALPIVRRFVTRQVGLLYAKRPRQRDALDLLERMPLPAGPCTSEIERLLSELDRIQRGEMGYVPGLGADGQVFAAYVNETHAEIDRLLMDVADLYVRRLTHLSAPQASLMEFFVELRRLAPPDRRPYAESWLVTNGPEPYTPAYDALEPQLMAATTAWLANADSRGQIDSAYARLVAAVEAEDAGVLTGDMFSAVTAYLRTHDAGQIERFARDVGIGDAGATRLDHVVGSAQGEARRVLDSIRDGARPSDTNLDLVAESYVVGSDFEADLQALEGVQGDLRPKALLVKAGLLLSRDRAPEAVQAAGEAMALGGPVYNDALRTLMIAHNDAGDLEQACRRAREYNKLTGTVDHAVLTPLVRNWKLDEAYALTETAVSSGRSAALLAFVEVVGALGDSRSVGRRLAADDAHFDGLLRVGGDVTQCPPRRRSAVVAALNGAESDLELAPARRLQLALRQAAFTAFRSGTPSDDYHRAMVHLADLGDDVPDVLKGQLERICREGVSDADRASNRDDFWTAAGTGLLAEAGMALDWAPLIEEAISRERRSHPDGSVLLTRLTNRVAQTDGVDRTLGPPS